MSLCIVLIAQLDNDTSPLAAEITPEFLTRSAAAFQIQLNRDVAPAWPYAVGAVVRAGSGPNDVGTGETPATVVPTLDNAPGAVAYHDDETPDGQPDEFLALDQCGGPNDVTLAQSHENNEVCSDPECNVWATVPAGLPSYPSGVSAGMQIALENADPVQDRTYPVDPGDGGPPVMCSDFCLPAYFDVAATGPTTQGEALGLLPRIDPFQRSPGGYQIARNADGSGETQVFGTSVKADRLRAGLHHANSRAARRGIKTRYQKAADREAPTDPAAGRSE